MTGAARRICPVVLAALAAAPAAPAFAQPATGPAFSASGPVDVGAVEVVDTTATATVHLANIGTGVLKLLDVRIVDIGTGAAGDWSYTAHAPCAAGIPPSCNLAGGQGVDLDIAFDPSAIAVRDAMLVVRYNDTADRSTAIALHGTGRGATLDLVGGQTVLDFGTQPLDTTASLTFQVRNSGTRDLTTGTVTLTTTGPSPISLTPEPTFTISAGGTTTFTVRCKSTTAGAFSADLKLAATDTASPPIDLTIHCAADSTLTLTATPPALMLGEVRTTTQTTHQLAIAGTGPTPLAAIALETANPDLQLAATPSEAPTTLDITIDALADADLTNHLIITPSNGTPLTVPITGNAVTAKSSVPMAISLGTFCVEQPTTPRIASLISTGTATITLTTPTLTTASSPYDLTLISPLLYPAPLAPQQAAIVAITPHGVAAAGIVTDDLVWTTDVAGNTISHTHLTTTFVDNGGAIAPSEINFAPAPIHLDLPNAQQVTLQNCDVSAIQLDDPQIPAPFTIDSPSFPSSLAPGETTTLSVGFHPTKTGHATGTLTITSPQLQKPLTVNLAGDGFASGGTVDAGVVNPGSDQTSFYSCGGCSSGGDPASLLVIAAALAALAPRRRRYHQRNHRVYGDRRSMPTCKHR